MDVEKTIEFILEQQAHVIVLQAKADETVDRIGRRLDRAVKLAVREARHERNRRQELDTKVAAAEAERKKAEEALDEKLTQLAASQLLTEEAFRGFEEKWKSFMEFMRRGGNGNH